jgi:hypothetical protein
VGRPHTSAADPHDSRQHDVLNRLRKRNKRHDERDVCTRAELNYAAVSTIVRALGALACARGRPPTGRSDSLAHQGTTDETIAVGHADQLGQILSHAFIPG